MIRCISLWQPWSTLVVIGAKKFETRDWPTRVRGLVGIHAAKIQRSRRDSFDVDEVFERPAFKLALHAAGYRDAKDLAYGALIGRASINSCKQIIRPGAAGIVSMFGDIDSERQIQPPPPPECEFGNYEPGRYAWDLSDPRRLTSPLPLTGRQGFWEIDDSLLAEVA